MFCGKCGNEIKDGLAFCPVCGDRFNEITYNAESNVAHKLNKNIKKRIISIVVAVAVVVGVVGIFRAIFSDSAEDVAIKYAEATEKLDLEECCECLAMDYEKFMDEYKKEFDKKIKIKNTSDILKYVTESGAKKFEEKDIDVSVKIIDSEEIDKSDVRKFLKDVQNLLDNFDGTDGFSLNDYIDKDKIGKAYKFSYKIKIKSEENSYSDKGDIIVAKYGWSWKIIGFPQDFDF